MYSTNAFTPNLLGLSCVIAGTVLLCSLYKDWWYTKRFRRESIDSIGMPTLAYRLVITSFLFTLQLLICIAALIHTSFAHLEAIALDEKMLALELEAFSYLWIAIAMAILVLALPITVDMVSVVRHFLSTTLPPSEQDLEINSESGSRRDLARLSLLRGKNHYPYRTDTHSIPLGPSYGTFAAGFTSEEEEDDDHDRAGQSLLETCSDSSANSLTPHYAPHISNLLPFRTPRIPPTFHSAGAASIADELRPDTVLQCDLFDADDEESEEEAVSPSPSIE